MELTAEFITALADALGGQIHRREDCRLPLIQIDSPLCLVHVSQSWRQRGKWHCWITDHQDRSIPNSSSANFTPQRPLTDIAADIRRRVLEPSRAAIIDRATVHGRNETLETESKRRAAVLADLFQTTPQSGYNAYLQLPGFRIDHAHNLQDQPHPYHRFKAEVSVKNFHALRMIAAIVAEDHRLNS